MPPLDLWIGGSENHAVAAVWLPAPSTDPASIQGFWGFLISPTQ